MLHRIASVLTKAQVQHARKRLAESDWIDGRVTAGFQSAQAKHNIQLPENSPVARELGDMILSALGANPHFMSAALPNKIFPPLFNCYREGHSFGNHVDNAIRPVRGTAVKIRTDLSMTLFLSEPDEYDGGELIMEDTYGNQSVKLGAGDLVLYPSTSLHRVEAITRGQRISSFFWLQSMIRSDEQRRILFDLDQSIQGITTDYPDDPRLVSLTGVYHNLLRQWGEC
jgi:PKHD-type hydroxylase